MSFLNKLTHPGQQSTIAQPYTQQQLLAQQQGQLYSTQQPIYGANNAFTEQQILQQQLVGSGAMVPMQQQSFVNQRSSVAIQEPATTTTLQPIVQQSIRQDRVVEVQPIIHRDIERPVVNHIERHITEPAPMSRGGAIQHGAIVEERVHNRVVNEIQPVIHREISVPQVEQVQQHYVERVVANPQHTRQVVYDQQQQQFLTGGQQFIGGQQQFLTGGQQFIGGQQQFLGGQQQFLTGGQQFIGGQPQYLQTGLVQSRALTGVGHISQAQYLQQQSLLNANPERTIQTNQLFGRDINGGLLQHQQLLPQTYGSSRVANFPNTPVTSALPPNMLNQQLLMTQQPMMTQQYISQPQTGFIQQPIMTGQQGYMTPLEQNLLAHQQQQQFGTQNFGGLAGQQQLYNNTY